MKIFGKGKKEKRDPWEILMQKNTELLNLAMKSAR